jgi:hypothetical protein
VRHYEAVSQYGYSGAELAAIRNGTALVAGELQLQLRITDQSELVTTEEISAVPQVFAAVTDFALSVY